jgi:hypothetical protein
MADKGNLTIEAAPEAALDCARLLAEAEAGLARLQRPPPISFRFAWCRIPFAGRIERAGDRLRLRVAGDLGPVPYTAEGADVRQRLLSLIRWSRRGGDYAFVASERHHLNLVGETEIAEPITGSGVLTGVTRLLLAARPHIQLAGEQRHGRTSGQV